MLSSILDNPIAAREWRLLGRRALDWRIWVGARWPTDPRVGGAPVIVTYTLAPYGLWAMLGFLRALHLVPPNGLPVDAFYLLVVAFWCYVIGISLVLGATAIAPDRERRTRDQLRLTALTAREQAAGFFWGRLGPVLASLTLTATFWCLLHPHYSRLLGTYMPQWVSWGELAAGTTLTAILCGLSGLIGLLASSRASRTSVAVVYAFLWFALDLVFPPLAAVLLAGFFVAEWSALVLIVWGFALFYVSLFMWSGLEAGLEEQ